MGRHAAPGLGGFFKDLGVFSLKVVFWGVVVFGGVLLIPKLLGGSTTTSTTAAQAEVITTTAPTTTTTAPTTTTTAPTTTAAVLGTTTVAPTTTSAVRDPSQVQVQVVNSTDRNGLAASLSEVLSARGYEMVESDNYPQALDTTHVWFSNGFDREAAVLASGFVPDAIVEEAPEPLDVDILVVIGASYEG